jgi:hypothetical protein
MRAHLRHLNAAQPTFVRDSIALLDCRSHPVRKRDFVVVGGLVVQVVVVLVPLLLEDVERVFVVRRLETMWKLVW